MSRSFPLLLRELIRRDLRSRFAGSALGFLWSFVQPLWQLVLFSFVFSTVLKIPLTGERTEFFALFLFCGLLPWLAVNEGLMRSATAITDNAALITKLKFPSELLPLAIVVSTLVHEAIAAALLVVALWWTHDGGFGNTLVLLPALLLQVLLTLGLGWLVSALQVAVRDTVQFLGMGLQAWFYLTPIVYPFAMVPDRLRPWVEWNPLTGLVGLYRHALLGSPVPSARALGALVGAAVLCFAAGLLTFQSAKATFADEL